MTKQEQAARNLKDAEAKLLRTQLEGKVAAAEAAIEKAEKALGEAKDQAGRDAAQKEVDLAKAAKRAAVEAIVTHDELQEKELKIDLVLNGGSCSTSKSYVGRVFDGVKALATSVF